jgi:hypothetical protein
MSILPAFVGLLASTQCTRCSPGRVRIGAVRVVYKAPLGTTSLEVFRDYEQMLADLGFEETFKLESLW